MQRVRFLITLLLLTGCSGSPEPRDDTPIEEVPSYTARDFTLVDVAVGDPPSAVLQGPDARTYTVKVGDSLGNLVVGDIRANAIELLDGDTTAVVGLSVARLEQVVDEVRVIMTARVIPVGPHGFGFELTAQITPAPGAEALIVSQGSLFWTGAHRKDTAPDGECPQGCGWGQGRGGQGVGEEDPVAHPGGPPVQVTELFPDDSEMTPAVRGSELRVEYVLGPYAQLKAWEAKDPGLSRHYMGSTVPLCEVVLHVSPEGVTHVELLPADGK